MSALAQLHPETTADPMTLRWVADTGTLTEPTAEMSGLLADGTLADLVISPGEIRTRLADGRSWVRDGQRVRTVLFQELSSLDGGTLLEQIGAVLRREVAPYVDSHGGDITVQSLSDDGTLVVHLGGTCGKCSLRTATLRNLVAKAVQDRFPEVRTVQATRA